MMLTAICTLLFVAFARGDPVAETPLGKVTGIVVNTVFDEQVEEFRGIPYAKAPVGDLRFDYPQPYGKLPDNFEAKTYPSACAQPFHMTDEKNVYSEDCLFLNVFRPVGTKMDQHLPVLAFIHGGGFVLGHGAEFEHNGAPLASMGRFIVVTLNYRLGILGFADMGELAPGNVAFYDQKMALEWIKDNIASFGGDPGRTTLMGFSAGSMSVSAHIMSPLTRDKDLFQAAVMASGALNRGLALSPENSFNRMKVIAGNLSCPMEGKEMLECLRKVDAKALTDISFDLSYSTILTFHPTLDGKYLAKDIEKDIQENSDKFAKVPLIIGTARDEGSIFSRLDPSMQSTADPGLKTEDEFLDYCSKIAFNCKYPMDFKDPSVRRDICETYKSQYNDSTLHGATEFMGDGTFVCPINNFIKGYAKHNKNMYVYRFERLLKKQHNFDPIVFGVYHTSPYIHYMGNLLNKTEVDPEDKFFFIESTKIIIDFVKTHKAPGVRSVNWPDYSVSGKIMVLDENPSVRGSLPHEDNCRKVFPFFETGTICRQTPL